MGDEPRRATHVFVVLNPVAGTSNSAEVRAALEQWITGPDRRCTIYETTGAEGEDVAALVRAAVADGADLVVAAGGDGTVSLVANALVGTDVPLGILPIGTANVLAQVLGMPMDLHGAVDLLAGDLPTARIDGIRLGNRHAALHISVGITSLMQRDTSREAKRRFGRLAYLWVAARWLFDFQPQRFMIVVDGVRHRVSASQVLIANGGAMGQPPFTWGPDIAPDDGVIDVCVINARTVRDYAAVAWSTLTGRHRTNQRLRYLHAQKSIAINSRGAALPVQLDGELAGTTPIQVQVVPGAFRMVVGPSFVAHGVPRAAAPIVQPQPLPTGEPVAPEQVAAAAPVAATLREKLGQIESRAQARQVVDALLREAEGATEPEVQPPSGTTDPATGVRRAASQPGSLGVAGALVETAAQVSAREGEAREALEQAAQAVTNPQLAGTDDPALAGPLALLREELLERMRPYQALDTRLFLAINGLPHPPLANQAMVALTTVMNGGWGWVLALIAAAALDHPRGKRALRQVPPALWFATMTVEYPIKHYFRRRRPFRDVVQAIAVGRKPGTYSFPSGHSAAAFAGAWLLTGHYPRLAPLWYLVAALVGFSRIYLGAHYPGDVVSGALTGTALAEVARRAIDLADEA
ncbi:MAG: hypothetical protein OHK0015_53650 [Chloroflexi bacterium OHK40]